jgi:predicted transcriptional regulator
MLRTTFAVKLDIELQKKVKAFCEMHGFKQSSFIEKAIHEQMEREELAHDLLDLYTLRSTESVAINFDEYLKGRK